MREKEPSTMDDTVYLDHNATTVRAPGVVEAMAVALTRPCNPSSVHRFGRLARRQVEEARQKVASLVGAEAEQVTFTSGGTEANVTVLRGCGRKILASAVEHASVLNELPGLNALSGMRALVVDENSVVDLQAFEDVLKSLDQPALVAVMLANNETGAIQPIADIVEMAKRYDCLVHCDAVQAVGKIPLSFSDLGVDSMSVSAHKIGGPLGIGALVAKDSMALDPLLRGGGQEYGRRGGTENVPGIVGFGVAAEIAAGKIEASADLAALRDFVEAEIKAIAPTTLFFGQGVARLPNTSFFATPGLSGEAQMMALDLAGVAVSSGSACSVGKVRISHVLAAMGVDEDLASCAIRVSFGWTSTRRDAERFIEAWGEIYMRIQTQSDSDRQTKSISAA
jgi:cysteine desulfurase